MYFLEVEADFEAAHRLPEYNGPCRRTHGHSYIVQAQYRRSALDEHGIAIDLVVLKNLLRSAVAVYDHQSLNSVMPCVPTAENIARVIWLKLRELNYGIDLTQVVVKETRDTRVIYVGD